MEYVLTKKSLSIYYGQMIWYISDTFHGLQIHLDRLMQLVFANARKSKLQFNSVDVEEMNDYEYLGNIIT